MTDTVMKTAIEIANKWGVFAVMALFFIWRGDVRETAMRDEMQRDRTYMRDTLVDALKQNTAALAQSSAVLARFTDSAAALEAEKKNHE